VETDRLQHKEAAAQFDRPSIRKRGFSGSDAKLRHFAACVGPLPKEKLSFVCALFLEKKGKRTGRILAKWAVCLCPATTLLFYHALLFAGAVA